MRRDPQMTLTFRYVIHDRVQAYLSAGWEIANDLADTHHGHYAVLMRWDRAGEPKEP
jgi:hypothetical protein